MKTDYGQGWLKFYINWRFPIGFVLGALSLIKEFADASSDGYLILPVFYIFAAVDIAFYIFRIIVYINMLNRTPRGYHLNNILLFAESIYISFTRALSTSATTSVLIMFPILALIMGLIWFWPNYVYFKHRRYLFGIFAPDAVPLVTSASSETSAQRDSASTRAADLSNHKEKVLSSDAIAITFCRNCGAKLIPDSAFCRKCGTKISSVFIPERGLPESDSIAETKSLHPNTSQVVSTTTTNLILQGKGLPPILRRAFLLIEDGEWDKADSYVERILDEDPENAFAYLAKLMIEFEAHDDHDLVEIGPDVARSRNFQKAFRYAMDEDLISYLARFN